MSSQLCQPTAAAHTRIPSVLSVLPFPHLPTRHHQIMHCSTYVSVLPGTGQRTDAQHSTIQRLSSLWTCAMRTDALRPTVSGGPLWHEGLHFYTGHGHELGCFHTAGQRLAHFVMAVLLLRGWSRVFVQVSPSEACAHDHFALCCRSCSRVAVCARHPVRRTLCVP